MKKLLFMSLMFTVCINSFAADTTEAKAVKSPEDALNKYLVDITGGAVSAANIVNVDKSLITNIQTSQDLVLAIRPFTSGDEKSGFGLALTPARSNLGFLSMSGNTYVSNPAYQLLGNLTFSYAQNNEDIKSITYKKNAFSVDTYIYLNQEADPIIIGNKVFLECYASIADANAKAANEIPFDTSLTVEQRQAKLLELTKQNAATLKPCMDKNAKAALEKAKWNSNRISISYGQAYINSASSDNEKLGKYLTINGMMGISNQSAVNLSFRKSKDVLDTKTLGTAKLAYSSSNLVALRYTYGDENAKSMRALAEVSNANKYSGSDTKGTFIYVLGIDKKLMDGVWLELRLGRNRTIESDKQQTTGLFNISIQPSLTAWAK
jgi:hypothetical protein